MAEIAGHLEAGRVPPFDKPLSPEGFLPIGSFMSLKLWLTTGHFDPWHPAVLRLIADVIARANAMGRGVSVCGEMAGDPMFTDLLLAMGLRSFSMHPARIAAVKQRLLRADATSLAAGLEEVLKADEPQAAVQALWPSP